MDTRPPQFDVDFVIDHFAPEVIKLQTGERLFAEGEPNDFVYYVSSGSIKVTKKKWAIGITYAYEFVGVTSCISEESKYGFSAVANEDSEVLRITKEKFKELLLKNSAFSKFIIEILCDRIRRTDLKTSSFLELPPDRRVIIELLNNFKQLGEKLISHLSIRDLAELTGVSKRVVKKLIADFVDQKIIATQGSNELVLLDRHRFEEILGNDQHY